MRSIRDIRPLKTPLEHSLLIYRATNMCCVAETMLKVRKVCTFVMRDQDQPIPLTARLLGYLALDSLRFFCVCETGTTGAGVRPVMMVLLLWMSIPTSPTRTIFHFTTSTRRLARGTVVYTSLR